ncbi:uncharacterized protein LOC136071647 [Hydra vulgaris]|uniref:Uncharacterized protein LOC136071647 n=1 Tax=Hydra vulgaris TaxID=6087 RepID=A0ABM4BK68_HYDVU
MINNDEIKTATLLFNSNQGFKTSLHELNQCSIKSRILQDNQQFNSIVLQSVNQRSIILKTTEKNKALSHCGCYHKYISALPNVKQMKRTKECLLMLRYIIQFLSLVNVLEKEVGDKIIILESFEQNTLVNNVHESMFKEFLSMVETFCVSIDCSIESLFKLGSFTQMIKCTFNDKIAYFQYIKKLLVFNTASSIVLKIKSLLQSVRYFYNKFTIVQSYLMKKNLVCLPTSALIYRFNILISLLTDFANDLLTNKIFSTHLLQNQTIIFTPLHCNKYSLTEYVQNIAQVRAEDIKYLLLNELICISNKIPSDSKIVQCSDYKYETFLNSRFLDDSSTNALKQIYKIIMAGEKNFISILFDDIQLTNSLILSGNFFLKSLDKVQISKTVLWDSNIGPIEKNKLVSIYTDAIWLQLENSFREYYLFSCIEMESLTKRLNDYSCLEEATNILRLFKKIENVAPSTYLNFLREAILSMFDFHNSQIWDSNNCKSMVIFTKDNFRYTESVPSSKTLVNLLLTQQNIESYYNIFSIISNRVSLSWIVDNFVSPWLTVCTFIYLCFYCKRQQYLSSASWGPFFVVTVLDIKYTLLCFQNMNNILNQLAVRDENFSCIPLLNLSSILESLKSFEEESYKMLNDSISRRTKTALEQHMPLGKVWKRRGSPLQAQEPNNYIKLVIEIVLAPVIENVSCLPQNKKIDVLCGCITQFIRSWMDYILLKKIKFSFFGSQQLFVDFQYFSLWFGQGCMNLLQEEINVIYLLPAFNKMKNAILLLSCQPSNSKKAEDSNKTLVLSSTSTLSQVSTETFTGSQFEDLILTIDMPKKENWLSLRVKGGSPKSAFLCIKKQE